MLSQSQLRNNHMSPVITTANNTERKWVIERPYGESLTIFEALYKNSPEGK